MKKPLLILGSGGFAREVAHWVPYEEYQIEAFFSEFDSCEQVLGRPVIDDLSSMKGMEFLVAVGDPKARERLWNMAKAAGLTPCAAIVHPSVILGGRITLDKGAIVCPGAILTDYIHIGKGAIINIGCTIGHDSVIDDFVTVSPGANISGNVHVGLRSYVGTGSCIREKVVIGEEATVGMGAVVVKNVPGGATVVGNPARQKTRKPLP